MAVIFFQNLIFLFFSGKALQSGQVGGYSAGNYHHQGPRFDFHDLQPIQEGNSQHFEGWMYCKYNIC